MVDFAQVVEVTLWFEGRLVDDPDDPGGLTNYGITQKLVDRIGLSLNVRTISRAQAIAFYEEWIWQRWNCPLLANLLIATKTFDMLVNFTEHAVTLLQVAINIFYGSNVVVVDGLLGQVTAAYANRIQDSDVPRFLSLLKLQQRAYYLRDVARNSRMQKYLNGWLRRAYWPYIDDDRPWPMLPKLGEGWPQGAEHENRTLWV